MLILGLHGVWASGCILRGLRCPPELVRDGREGYVIAPPSDAVALADRLAALKSHPELRMSMGVAGRVRIEQLIYRRRSAW